MKKTYFAVDLGATSGRTILAQIGGEGVEMEVINRFPNHLIQVGHHFHWDIYELYRNIVEGLAIVASRGIAPVSIGIDTWGVDFVTVGRDGGLLRLPYSYRDPHTEGAPEALFERLPREKVYGKTGIQVMNFNTLFQFDTLRRCGDSAYASADKVLFMPDALSYMLTGEAVTEYTIASTGQIVDARTRTLDEELLSAVGLRREQFGRWVFPGERVGFLREEVQRMTGLGAVPVIAVAGHDTASAVAAVPAATADFAYLSSGTWSLMGVETHAPVIDGRTSALNFTNEGGVEGAIRLLKNICGMWLLERCRTAWPDADYQTLTDECSRAEAFRSVIFPDAPCFANPADMRQAIVGYCEATRQPAPRTRGEFVRCIFESLALRYRQVIDDLKQLADHPIRVLHVIGGGSRNALLNQWTANAVGMPVVAGPAEATALGNVMVQAVAAGEAQSVGALRATVRRSLDLATFAPADTDLWNRAYAQYLKITKQN